MYTYSFIKESVYLLSLAQPKRKWIGPYYKTQRNSYTFISINRNVLLLMNEEFQNALMYTPLLIRSPDYVQGNSAGSLPG